MTYRTLRHAKSRLVCLGAVGVLATVSFLSSCSSVTSDAATVNGESLSRDTFETLLDGYADAIPTSRLPNGAVDISIARGLLTDWVTTRVLLAELDGAGVEVSPADLDRARAGLEPQSGFEVAAPETQDFYVLAIAVRTVFSTTFGLSQDEARATYESPDSTIKCLRGILAGDIDTINTAALRLLSGEDFGALAAEVSTDATKANGGILSDQQGGSECLSVDSLAAGAPEFIAALEGVGVGTNTAPFQLTSGDWVILHVRPFDEVAGEVLDILGATSADDARIAAIVGSDVSVSSEYGRWNPATGTVTER